MNPPLFQELKLFWGAVQEVADLRGCPHENVRKVLKVGKWRDERIEKIAHEVVAERKAKMLAQLTAHN